MVCTVASLLYSTVGLAIREAAASAVAVHAADLGVRRVAGVEEDHLIDAGGVLGTDNLSIKD